MPVRADLSRLERLRKNTVALATPGSPERQQILDGVARAIKRQLREQFARGTDPSGSTQAMISGGGRPGLQLRDHRYGNLVVVEPTQDGFAVRASSQVPEHLGESLEAHQEGHTFAPHATTQHRDARGRLISFARFVALAKAAKERTTSGAYEGFSRTLKSGEHRLRAFRQKVTSGARVLPQRRIYPVGQLTAVWRAVVQAAIDVELGRLFKRR